MNAGDSDSPAIGPGSAGKVFMQLPISSFIKCSSRSHPLRPEVGATEVACSLGHTDKEELFLRRQERIFDSHNDH